jgi:serine/threonine-protein phosphatase 2A activator
MSIIDNPRLAPKSILNKDMIDAYSDEYMYFRCIQYILEVKNKERINPS